MALKIPGSATTSGYQGVQGMSKGPASMGPSPSGKAVVKNGIKAKGTQKMPKSSKKKVIVNALLGMMNKGSKQMGGSKLMSGKHTNFGD